MRVALIYQSEQSPSSRIRIIQLKPYLEALGLDCTLMPYSSGKLTALDNYDVVVIQKKMLSWASGFRWRRVKSPVVFDFDDAILFRDEPKDGSFESHTRRGRFNRTLAVSSAVVCGNDYLAGLCPNSIPTLIAPSPVPHQVPQRDYGVENNVTRIGWIGGGRNLPMLDLISDSLQRLSQSQTFELHIISDRDYGCDGLNIINHRWSMESQESLLATLDIGLMPLEDTPWSRGKCSYKLLQYMAAGVVAVGSDVGMNKEIITHGKTGYLAEKDNWDVVLAGVISDKQAMSRVGNAARAVIQQNFTYESYAKKWADLIYSLA